MEPSEKEYGYEESIFISQVPEYFLCMVCTLVPRNPVQILCCGHKMCGVCYQRIKTHSVMSNTELCCPIDKAVVDVNDVHEDVYLKRLIGNMVVRCRNHDLGCYWSGDLRELDNHVDQCPFNSVQQREMDAVCLNMDMVKELTNRLEQCESSLIDKNKEITLLQQQLKEEVRSLKQQQQEDIAYIQQKNDVMEQKVSELSEKLTVKNVELHGAQQDPEQRLKNLQQEHKKLKQQQKKLKRQRKALQQQEVNDLRGLIEDQPPNTFELSTAKEQRVVIQTCCNIF